MKYRTKYRTPVNQLTASIICGQKEILFDKILLFCVLWTVGQAFIQTRGISAWGKIPNFLNLAEPAAVRAVVDKAKRFHQLLDYSRIYSSTDPRDKLYGLFGLAQHAGFAMNINPDYAKPVPLVFIEFTRAKFKETGELILDGSNSIGLELRGVPRISGLPSWGTDYTYWEQ